MASVSVRKATKGKWRLRWREYPLRDGVRGELGRSYTVGDKRTADEMAVEIRRAVETQGHWRPPAEDILTPCNLEAKAKEWLIARRGAKRANSTNATAASALRGFFLGLRATCQIPKTAGIPGTALSRSGYVAALDHLVGADKSDDRLHTIGRYALDFWRWLSDEPESERVGVERAPQSTKLLVPRKPLRGDPPPTATIAELDATLREAKHRRSKELLGVLLFLRFTALRVDQVLRLLVSDYDPSLKRLWVDTGKGGTEKRGRYIPVAAPLRGYIERLLSGKPREDLIFRYGQAEAPSIPSSTLHSVLIACEERGELRADVWRHRSRGNSRTTHLYRAALQHFWSHPPPGLTKAPTNVINALVGHAHAGSTVRDQFYVPPEWDDMVRAVEMLPDVNWGEVPDASAEDATPSGREKRRRTS